MTDSGHAFTSECASHSATDNKQERNLLLSVAEQKGVCENTACVLHVSLASASN